MSPLIRFWREMKSPGMMLLALLLSAGVPCLMCLLVVCAHLVIFLLWLGGALVR